MLELVARQYGIPSMRSLVPASKGLLVNLVERIHKIGSGKHTFGGKKGIYYRSSLANHRRKNTLLSAHSVAQHITAPIPSIT